MMIYNRLGRTDVELSAIGFGTAELRMVPERQAIESLKHGFRLGINWVQVSPDYEGSESIVIRAIRESGCDVMVLNLVSGEAADFKNSFESTCRQFNKDRLEMYGISCIDDAEYLGMNVWNSDGMVPFLMDMKKEGRLGAIICSTHGSPDFVEKLVKSKVFDGIMLAYNPLGFHLNSYFEESEGRVHEDLRRNMESIFPLSHENCVSLLIMKPLAGGLLCRGKSFKPREWFAGEVGALTATEVLQSILALPSVCSVIPGMASIAEADENARAGFSNRKISSERFSNIENITLKMKESLCSKCGECESTCDKSLRISMMFREGYFWIYRSKTSETIDRLHYFQLHPSKTLTCHSCTNRTCRCPQGIDIPRSLDRIHKWMLILQEKMILPPPPQHQGERVASNGSCSVMLLSAEVPETLKYGENRICRFWIQNIGEKKWLARDAESKALALGIYCKDKMIMQVRLRHDVEIGMRTHFSFELNTFDTEGRYTLSYFLMPLEQKNITQENVLIYTSLLKVEKNRKSISAMVKLIKKTPGKISSRLYRRKIIKLGLFDATYYAEKYPELKLPAIKCLDHYLTAGWKENRNPHSLFDTEYYLEKNQDVANVGVNPLIHFVKYGWKENRNPHPLFDMAYYLEQIPELNARPINPLIHYLESAAKVSVDPHPLFDTVYYKESNPGAAADRINPLIHYLEHGWKEQKTPHPSFSIAFYIDKTPYLSRLQSNPLLHYLKHMPEYGVAYVEHNLPPHLSADIVHAARITLENTGTRIWTRNQAAGKNVEMMVSVDNTHVSSHPLSLSHVYPGEKVTIHFPFKAPTDRGLHRICIELVELNVSLFKNNGVDSLIVDIEIGEKIVDSNSKYYKLASSINPWYYQPTQGISKGADGRSFPLFISRTKGCYSWDLDDKQYIDYVMGYGSILLGYSDPRIQKSIVDVLDISPITTFPNPLEMQVAQMLTEDIPSAEMVVFGKNGSDVCTVAARLSRLYTGKKIILCCGYHGWQDFWVEQFDFGQTGVPDRSDKLIHPFKFNDLDDFYRLYNRFKDDLAAVMIEPSGPWGGEFRGHEPDIDVEFLAALSSLAKKSKALLVFDEIVTGFRYPRGSVQRATGIIPDLTCLGKALASGMPLSALVGRAEIFQRGMKNVWYCPTFKGEIYSFAAARTSMQIYREEPVADYIWHYGEVLKIKINDICNVTKVDAECKGPPFRMALTFNEPNIDMHRLKRTLLQQELLKGGLITLNGVMLPSYSHDEAVMTKTATIFGEAMEMIAMAERKNDYHRYIEIPIF